MDNCKTPRTIEELETIASYCLRQHPGLDQIEGATIDLDEDGRWAVGIKAKGDVDVAAINRGRKAVEDSMREQYSLKTDT